MKRQERDKKKERKQDKMGGGKRRCDGGNKE